MSQQNQNTHGVTTNNEILMSQIKSIIQNFESKGKSRQEEDPAQQTELNAALNQLNNAGNQGAYVSTNYKDQNIEEGQILKDLVQQVNKMQNEQSSISNQAPNQVMQEGTDNFQIQSSQNLGASTDIAPKGKPNCFAQPGQVQQTKTNNSMSPQNIQSNLDPQLVTNDLLQSPVSMDLIKKLQEGKIEFTQFVTKLKTLIPMQQRQELARQPHDSNSTIQDPNLLVDKTNQNMTHCEEIHKDIYQNQTHPAIQQKFKNQNQQNQQMQPSQIQSNFDVPSNINSSKQGEVKQSDTTEKQRHNSQNRVHQGAMINKMHNQTFFEDVFPQVNTLQKTKPQNQFQLLNEMMVRTQKTQKTQQQLDLQNSNQQDSSHVTNSISRSLQANLSNNSGTASAVINQRGVSSDVNQQSTSFINNIKLMNVNEFHKTRAIQSPFNIQKQTTQGLAHTQQESQGYNINQNKSKDSRQSKQSNKSKQSRTSDGQVSSSLQQFQKNRLRKVFENDSQSHDEAQAEPSTKNFQGSAWKPHKKRDLTSSNNLNTDDQNPQLNTFSSLNANQNQITLNCNSFQNQSQTEIQNMLMKLIVQKINQEINVSKDTHSGSIATNLTTFGEMAGQNTFVTDDKNQSDTHGIDAQRVEEKAADIQQLILDQIREKAQKLQVNQRHQYADQSQSLENNNQNSSNPGSAKVTDKDDTAVFPLPSQLSQANQPEPQPLDSMGQDSADLNNNKQMNECEAQNTETLQENPTIMSKDEKVQSNQNSLSNPQQSGKNIGINQINLDNFPSIPEPLRQLIIKQQNQAAQIQKKTENIINYNSGSGGNNHQDSGSGNGNNGSRNGSGSGSGNANGSGNGHGSGNGYHNSSTGENEGLNISKLHEMIENYIPQDAQQTAHQASEIQKPQDQVNHQNQQIQFKQNESDQNQLINTMRQFTHNQAPQSNLAVPQDGQPQRMRYNGPTSSSGSGEEQNRQGQPINEVPQTKTVQANSVQQNSLQTVNDLKQFFSNLQGQQDMAKLIQTSLQSQQPQMGLLGKRLLNERSDAVDSALLQKQLTTPLNLIQQIQNVQSNNQAPINIDSNAVNKAAFNQDQMKFDGPMDQCQEAEGQIKQGAKEDLDNDYDDDTPMQIRLRNQIRNNQSKHQFRQVKLELLKAIKSEKDMSKTIIDAKPKRPHHNMGGEMFRGSRYRGVSKNKNKWQMMIMINQKKVYIGAIQNEFDAARYYDHIAIISQGLSAKTNFKYSAAKIQQIVQDYDIESQDCSSNENYPQSLSSNDNQLLQQINVFKNQRVQPDRNANLQMIEQHHESMYRPATMNQQSLLQNSDFKNKLDGLAHLLNLQQQAKAQQQQQQQLAQVPSHQPSLFQSQQSGQNQEMNNIQLLLDRQQSSNQMARQMRPAQAQPQMNQSHMYEVLLSKYNNMKQQQQNNVTQNNDYNQSLAKLLSQKMNKQQINTDSWQMLQSHMSHSSQQNANVGPSMIQQMVRQQLEDKSNMNQKGPQN